MPEPTPLARKIEELNSLRDESEDSRVELQLQAALKDQSNRVIAKSAELILEFRSAGLTTDLLNAYQRMFVNPLKKDPGCVAKTAIVTTLVEFEYQDPEPFRRGIKYQQYEPIWGGQEDTAPLLRAACAAGMVTSASTMDALICFGDLLADPYRGARIGAARAIAGLGHWEGIPLLRMKLLWGNEEPEVTGECCSALLSLSGDEGLELVSELLDAHDVDTRIQAALALGEQRCQKALDALRECWKRELEPSARGLLLTSIGLLRSKEGEEFLVSLITGPDESSAADAIRALAPYSMIEELRERVEAAVTTTGSDRIRRVFEDEFAR